MSLRSAMAFALHLCGWKGLVVGLPQNRRSIRGTGGELSQDIVDARFMTERSRRRAPVRGMTMEGRCTNVLRCVVASSMAGLWWWCFAENKEFNKRSEEQDD